MKVRLKHHLTALSQLCAEIRNTNPDNGLQPAAKNGLSEPLGQNEKCHFSVTEIGFVLDKNTWNGAASVIYALSLTKSWKEGFVKDSSAFLICLRAGKSQKGALWADLCWRQRRALAGENKWGSLLRSKKSYTFSDGIHFLLSQPGQLKNSWSVLWQMSPQTLKQPLCFYSWCNF